MNGNHKLYVTKELLDKNPDWVFVFGDNLIHKGYGGAAKLRDHPQSYGFITKKYPDWKDSSFYTPEEYRPIFNKELARLEKEIANNQQKKFLITPLGSGLANRFLIYQEVILPGIKDLQKKYHNVILIH